MFPCVCLCVNVRVCLIYLTDLHPSRKAMGVRNTVLSLMSGSVLYMGVIASENEKYQQIQESYINLSASCPTGYQICL